MSATVGSTDHSSMRVLCPTKRFFYSLFIVSNPPQPGTVANIRWTRLLLAAICAALILPTFFLRFMRTAAATAAGMRNGRIPPCCFRRLFRRRGPQCMIMICPMEDAPLVFYSFLHDGTIERFPRISFPFAGGHFPSTFFTNGDSTLGLMIPDGFGDPITSFENAYG